MSRRRWLYICLIIVFIFSIVSPAAVASETETESNQQGETLQNDVNVLEEESTVEDPKAVEDSLTVEDPKDLEETENLVSQELEATETQKEIITEETSVVQEEQSSKEVSIETNDQESTIQKVEEEELETEDSIQEEAGETVVFKDKNLEKLIREDLGLRKKPITKQDLQNLESLYIADLYGDINSLVGLEHAVNLTYLDIESVSINDLSVLRSLQHITELTLTHLPVSNIDVLDQLPALETLYIGYLDVDLAQNPVIQSLQAKGVKVQILEGLYIDLYKVSESSATISWGHYSLESIDKYELYVDGKLKKTFKSDESEYRLTGLEPNTIYQLELKAISGSKVVDIHEVELITLGKPTGNPIKFPDPNLKLGIQEELGIEREVYESDLEGLTELYLGYMDIGSLTGLEKAKNLTTLMIYENNIEDLTPLIGLEKLTTLHLEGNPLSDKAVLKKLDQVESLSISYSAFNDLTFLTEMARLQEVYVYGSVELEENKRFREEVEFLESHQITVHLELGEGIYIDLSPDYVNESKIGLSWTVWTEEDEFITPDKYVLSVNGKEETLNGDVTSKVLSNLTPNTEYEIVLKAYIDGSLAGKAYLTETTRDLPTGNVVHFKDPKLEQAIKDTLGLDRDLRESDIENLETLSLPSSSISDLSGLEKATNLMDLTLSGNKIKDLTPLKNLTNLVLLDLSKNPIEDLSPLADLEALDYLDLSEIKTRDFKALSGLSNLSYLSLSKNKMNNIAELTKITSLVYLDLYDNNISNLNGIEQLANLDSLHLGKNPISDFSPLSKLNLTSLEIPNTNLTSLEWIKSMTGLEALSISGNPIKDLSPLKNLENLYFLSISNTNVDDISILLELPNLIYVSMYKMSKLDLTEDSEAMEIIRTLEENDVFVAYDGVSMGFLELTSIESTDRSIAVSWFSELNELVTEYRVYLDGELVTELDNSQNTYVINDLAPNTEYEITIEAYFKGELIDRVSEVVMTKEAIKKPGQDDKDEDEQDQEQDQEQDLDETVTIPKDNSSSTKGEPNSNGKGAVPVKAESDTTKKGHSLPVTATNSFNLILVGLVVVLVGGAMLLVYRRKNA
ncbi:LPXTG cell wall anchor domain-containing protein [Niallia sp. XMNu-256]|uniref:leucine-rich repeat domain-containing protein n=1 Tax=Niallia sp. XMNu-256 TaxID=3082444 RepID=UPI0030CDC808